MKLSDSLSLAVKNIISKKFRTFLNILGIMIGVSSIVAIMCVGMGGEKAVNGKLDKMGLNVIAVKTCSSYAENIKFTDYEYLYKLLPDVSMTPIYMNYATLECGDKTRDVVVWGVSPGFENIYNINISSGRFFTPADVKKEKKVAIVEGVVAQKLFGNTNLKNEKISLVIKGKQTDINITGVIDDSDEGFKSNFSDSIPAFVYMPVTTAMNFFNSKSLDYISLKPNGEMSMEDLGIKSVRLLERKTGASGKYYAENMTRQKEVLDSVINLISIILGTVAAISLVVGALGIMNIMIVSVTERTGEIGMMKAIGAQNSDIMLQFLIEATIITFVGAILGSIFGILAGYFITNFAGLPFDYSFTGIAFIIAVVSVSGLIFGVYPAKLAAGLDPVDALR